MKGFDFGLLDKRCLNLSGINPWGVFKKCQDMGYVMYVMGFDLSSPSVWIGFNGGRFGPVVNRLGSYTEVSVDEFYEIYDEWKKCFGVVSKGVSEGVSEGVNSDAIITTSTGEVPEYYRTSISPLDYIMANGLGFCEGNVVKYVSRYKGKGGVEDLKKARHYLDILIGGME
jgi:hypothetical protein